MRTPSVKSQSKFCGTAFNLLARDSLLIYRLVSSFDNAVFNRRTVLDEVHINPQGNQP